MISLGPIDSASLRERMMDKKVVVRCILPNMRGYVSHVDDAGNAFIVKDIKKSVEDVNNLFTATCFENSPDVTFIRFDAENFLIAETKTANLILEAQDAMYGEEGSFEKFIRWDGGEGYYELFEFPSREDLALMSTAALIDFHRKLFSVNLNMSFLESAKLPEFLRDHAFELARRLGKVYGI